MSQINISSLITYSKIIFAEYSLPREIVSDVGANFVSEKFKEFGRKLNIEQAISSAYNHQSNGQKGTGIKFVNRSMKKCLTVTFMEIQLSYK